MRRDKLIFTMFVKTRGYCFSFLFIFTITTITLPSGSWCGVHFSKHDSNLDLKHDGNNVLTTRGHQKMLNSDSKRTEEIKSPTNFSNLKNRHKLEINEESSMFTSTKPPNADCTEGKIRHVTHGKFTITGQLEANIPHVGYQSDSDVSAQSQDGRGKIRGQRPSGSEESWQRLQPVVECGDDGMTLTVRRRRAVQLLLDRVNQSSMPLSQLSPDCGYMVQSSWKDLSLMAQYDACHVTQENDHYVLPLLWRGAPVKMSCPASQTEPQVIGPFSLCCSPNGLSIKVNGLSDSEELRVNVRGEWTPLEALAEQCGYTVDRQDEEIFITAPFITCGITVKDGKHTLSLQTGGKTFTLTCPISPSELPLPPQPLIDQKPESTEHLPWAPPFYLAPPYYPHPTYHHTHPHHDAEHTPTPSPSPPDPVFVPRAHPPLHHQTSYYRAQISPSSSEHVEDSSEVHHALQINQEALPQTPSTARSASSDAGFLTQEEAPPLQQPGHAFTQYYHYYHHPKIPLTDPTSDPGPEVPKELPPNPNSTPPRIQTSEASSDPFSLPGRPEFTQKASQHIYPPPAYPHHFFYYFPHVARDEDERSPPLNPKTDDQNTEASGFLLGNSSQINLNPDETKNLKGESAEWIKVPLLSEEEEEEDDDDEEVADKAADPRSFPPDPDPDPVPEQPTFTPPASNHHHPYYPYYLHPYYYYNYYLHLYHLYSGAQSLPSYPNPISPTLSKSASDPLPPTSPSTPQQPTNQTPPPSSKTINDAGLHPFYHYYPLYYQPEVSTHDQKPQRPPSYSDVIRKDRSLPVTEAGFPSMHQPLQSFYSDHFLQHHPCDPDGGEEARVDVMRDQLQADPYAPSSSPCGLGRVSDIDCSTSPGSCLYSVEVLEPIHCSMGEHLIFVVLDSALEDTEVLPAHPPEVFDQTEFYLFEDDDFFSFEQDLSSE